MNMLDMIMEKFNLDAHKYELDRSKLKSVYNFPEKIKRDYKVIEKKIIYATENNKLEVNKQDIEKSYYSSYKYFRNYLSTGFQYEDIVSEIKEMKSILKDSKSLRDNIQKYLDINYEDNNIIIKEKIYLHLLQMITK